MMLFKCASRLRKKAVKFKLFVKISSVALPDKSRPKTLAKGDKIVVELCGRQEAKGPNPSPRPRRENVGRNLGAGPSQGLTAPKYPERAKKLIGTWDKESKDGKEIEHTRGEKLVSGDARISDMANKTEYICG